MRVGAALALALGLTSCALETKGPTDVGLVSSALGAGAFEEVASFGANPGGLKMFRYVPNPAPTGPAGLVVALHACSQSASAYRAAGWEALADAHGFYVIYPEQQILNNSLRCFNWAGEYGNPENLTRGQGENQSIVSMVERMKADYGIDAAKVILSGHSGGGAQAALMMATWPEVFAGSGIMAGIPYHCTTSFVETYSCLTPGKNRSPLAWGDLVRDANPGYAGTWPRLSVWHGTTDSIVAPANQTELIEQWADVYGIDTTAEVTDNASGYTRSEHHDASGQVLIESWELTGQGHGTFVDPDAGCGATGSYFLDADICAAEKIAERFGLIGASPAPGPDPTPDPDPDPMLMPMGDDTERPFVNVAQPVAGAMVEGVVTILVDATDNVAVERVAILVDGVEIAETLSAPYQVRWDATAAGPGNHRIAAMAFDAAGNMGLDDDTVVKVAGNESAMPMGPTPEAPMTDPVDDSLSCHCATTPSWGGSWPLVAVMLGLWVRCRRKEGEENNA